MNLAPFLSADHSSSHFLGVDSIWAEASSGSSTPRGDSVHSARGLALTSQRPASPPPQCNVRNARSFRPPSAALARCPFTTRVLVFQSFQAFVFLWPSPLCYSRLFSLMLPPPRSPKEIGRIDQVDGWSRPRQDAAGEATVLNNRALEPQREWPESLSLLGDRGWQPKPVKRKAQSIRRSNIRPSSV